MDANKIEHIRNEFSKFMEDYDNDYINADGTITIPACQMDYFMNSYLNRDIYIESIRWAAGEWDESFIYITYYHWVIWHTVLCDEALDQYDFDTAEDAVNWFVEIREYVNEDMRKVTKVQNAPHKIAHAIIEYLSEWGDDINEKDLTELIKDYLYSSTNC